MRSVLVLLSLATFSPVFAWDEPSGFRGVPWGASVETVREKFPELTCRSASQSRREDSCFGKLPLGPVTALTALGFSREGGLRSVMITFASSACRDLKAMLIERYGEPTKRGTEELRDTAGEGLKDEVLDWAGRSVFIRIRCHTHADTTLGYISIGTGFTFPPNMPLR